MEIRCSSLARPMVCAGYVFLDLPKSPTNPAAEEGTAAGEYLERLLLDKPISSHAENGVYFDEDMKFYLKSIEQDIKRRAASPILCEERIDWQTRSGVSVRGQYDVCFVDHEGTLCVEDLKYGWGIIEVKENWQLLGYAIGEVIRRGEAFENISLKIHQPRPHHEDGETREWRLTYSELIEYKEKIEDRMTDIVNGNRKLTTSSKCKYCQGAAEACPAFSRLFYRALEVTTEFHQDSLTEDEISRQLDQVHRAEEVIRIKKDSIVELGVNRIKEGKIIPNYVQSKKYGHRTWKSGVSAKAVEMMTGKKVTEEVFMSPTKAEKLGVSKKLIKQLCEKQFRGMKLEKKDTTEIGNSIFGNTNPTGGK